MSRVSSFRYAAGYSPDGGKTQWIVAAKSMRTLRRAWNSISGQELEFDEDLAVCIKTKKVKKPRKRVVVRGSK